MNNRKAKITVDIFMTIFVILSFVRWDGEIGFIFHAVVGSVFALLAAAHLYLNRKWVVSVTKSVIAKKANSKTKQIYIVDMILTVVWGIAIITGFLAIPSFANDVEAFYVFSRIHAVSSRIGAVIILVHIYQHLGHIRSYIGLKKKPKSGVVNEKNNGKQDHSKQKDLTK